jgi:hypothetical protein
MLLVAQNAFPLMYDQTILKGKQRYSPGDNALASSASRAIGYVLIEPSSTCHV